MEQIKHQYLKVPPTKPNLLSSSRDENHINMQSFVLKLYKTSNVEKVLAPNGITLMNHENKRS